MEASSSAARDLETARNKYYAFGNTQPVPKFDEDVTENTYIEADIPIDKGMYFNSGICKCPNGFCLDNKCVSFLTTASYEVIEETGISLWWWASMPLLALILTAIAVVLVCYRRHKKNEEDAAVNIRMAREEVSAALEAGEEAARIMASGGGPANRIVGWVHCDT